MSAPRDDPRVESAPVSLDGVAAALEGLGHPQCLQRPATITRPAAERDLAGNHRRLRPEQGKPTAYQGQGRLAMLHEVAPQPPEEVLPRRAPYDDRVCQHAA